MKRIVLIFLCLLMVLFPACSLSEPSSNLPITVVGYVTTNQTLTDSTNTTLTGLIIGIAGHLYYVTCPVGTVVGTTDTQELTNKTLNAMIAKGTWTASGTWTLPAFSMNGDITSGTKNVVLSTGWIKTANLLLKQGSTTQWYIKNSEDSAYAGLVLGNLQASDGDIVLAGTTNFIRSFAADGYAARFGARDSEVGNVEVGRLQGASQPYFALGGAQQYKFYNSGYMSTTSFLELVEMSAPGAGATNTARIYSVVGGDELTDLVAVFQDGTVDIFAQETTLLNAPQLSKSSGSIGTLVMIKKHPGLTQYVMQFSDGSKVVLKEVEYHDADIITANKGCESNKLPEGWEVTTAQQRIDRIVPVVIPEVLEPMN